MEDDPDFFSIFVVINKDDRVFRGVEKILEVKYARIMYSSAVFLYGCQPQTELSEIETREKFEEARLLVETVERMKDEYTQDFMIAQNELEMAEENLQKRRISDAYFAASRSLEASERILRQFNLNTVTKLVEKAKTEIETSTQSDPDNPLKEFLPELDAMLDYADQIQQNPEAVDLVKVVDHLSQATQITENINANTQLTLDSDISFGRGEYVLTLEEKSALDRLIYKIIQTKNSYLLQFPNKDVTIKIKVVGYTDESGFREGTALVRELTEGFEQNVPQDVIERRKFLNQRLSTLRAKNIRDYIQQKILESEPTDSHVSIKQEIVGKGEEIPPGVKPPYPVNDPRRWICKVYSYVIAR